MSATRPLLNYYGGKWRIASWIISNFPEHKIYVEPFGGSLSVLMRKDRSKREIVNDIDSELVNLYRMARDHGHKLRNNLNLTPHSREEYLRSMVPSDYPIEQARRTVVRCYFGIGDSFLHNHNAFRTSKTSNTAVEHSWQSYIDAFDGIIERLKGVTIENLSYEKMFEKHDSPETLWYFDPPYLPETRSRKHSYRVDWSAGDHQKFLSDIQSLKGKIVLSGYESEMYSILGWDIVRKEAACNGGSKKTECLYLKDHGQQKLGGVNPK